MLDRMQPDLVIDCRFLPIEKVGALTMIHDKWVIFAAGHWYLFPHFIWKRVFDDEALGDLEFAGCNVFTDVTPGIANRNAQLYYSTDLEDFWIELPIVRATERLMIRGRGHEIEWIDDEKYKHSFQYKSFDPEEQVGELNVECRQLRLEYPNDPDLASLLFRNDQAPVIDTYPSSLFLRGSAPKESEDDKEEEDDDNNYASRHCLDDGGNIQPITFLASHWTALQLYLVEVYKCDPVPLSTFRVHWTPIREWDANKRNRANNLTSQFPFLHVHFH